MDLLTQKFKAELTIPAEQYGNIRPEVEGTIEDIVAVYRAFSKELQPRPVNEMPKRDFDAVVDDLLEDGSINGDPGMCEAMSPVQNEVIQAIKRSIKRRNNK